jgi:hypothetical protein
MSLTFNSPHAPQAILLYTQRNRKERERERERERGERLRDITFLAFLRDIPFTF